MTTVIVNPEPCELNAILARYDADALLVLGVDELEASVRIVSFIGPSAATAADGLLFEIYLTQRQPNAVQTVIWGRVLDRNGVAREWINPRYKVTSS